MGIGLTVQEASRPENINRSPNWIRAAIRLGKIKAQKFGNTNLITNEEIERTKANPPVISREEMINSGVAKS